MIKTNFQKRSESIVQNTASFIYGTKVLCVTYLSDKDACLCTTVIDGKSNSIFVPRCSGNELYTHAQKLTHILLGQEFNQYQAADSAIYQALNNIFWPTINSDSPSYVSGCGAAD